MYSLIRFTLYTALQFVRKPSLLRLSENQTGSRIGPNIPWLSDDWSSWDEPTTTEKSRATHWYQLGLLGNQEHFQESFMRMVVQPGNCKFDSPGFRNLRAKPLPE